MRIIFNFSMLLALSLGNAVIPAVNAEPCGSQGQARCGITDVIGLDEHQFADEVADYLTGKNLKGWSVTLVDNNGKDVVRISDGISISATESGGPQPFYTSTVSGIGSVSKVFTEAAVRHAIEMKQALPAYQYCSVSLNTPFLDVLPSVFAEIAHDDYKEVTIEDILQHKGGVPVANHNGPTTPHWNRKYQYWETLKKFDLRESHKCYGKKRGEGCYNNDNYVLATMMLGIIGNSCEAKAFFDTVNNVACKDEAPGRSRQECMVHHSFDILGRSANVMVKKWILDPLKIQATCDPRVDPVLNGQRVAKGYSSQTDITGSYVRSDSRACGAGRWHMSSKDLARAIRYISIGSFFFDHEQGVALPNIHNGSLKDQGAQYRATMRHRKEDFFFTFTTNSEVNTDDVRNKISEAFSNAILASFPPPSSGFMESIRGDWRCIRHADSAEMILQSYGSNDTRAYHLGEFGGKGSKEIWSLSIAVGTYENGLASGTYTHYKALHSMNDAEATGRWSIREGHPGSFQVKRIDDVTKWEGVYTCTPN